MYMFKKCVCDTCLQLSVYFVISMSSFGKLNTCVVHVHLIIRSEDNWKLFSPNSGPPCPSRRTHPSGCMMTEKVEQTIKIAI
jgi:hypothetical protein